MPVQTSIGGYHTIIYTKNGEVYVFGYNNYGQLGLGNIKNQNMPQLLMTDKEIRQIACGQEHSIILKKNGELFVFGSNKYGQLGFEDKKIKINQCY